MLGLIGESGAGKSTLGLAAMGFARDGCRISAGIDPFRRRSTCAPLPEAERRTLRGMRIAYVAQSAAAELQPGPPADRPVSRRSACVHARDARGRGEATRSSSIRRLRLPNPETIGQRYPAPGLGRAAAAGDDGDGDGLPARPDRLRRADHGARRDHADRGAGGDPGMVRQFGTAAIYITHDLAVVAQMADRIMVLLRGEEVEEADTRSMLAAPREDYTRSLWAVRSFARAEQPPATGTPVVSVRGVTAGYGAVKVLNDISFDIPARRTVAVVGESGSGKSTTARVITGLLAPRKGEVLFDGKALPPSFKDRSRAGAAPMPDDLPDGRHRAEPEAAPARDHRAPGRDVSRPEGQGPDARIRDLLALIELEPDNFIDRLPGELSGGQKQRIGIARALAAEPQLIICDEVTSALDQIVHEGILKLLDRLQSELDLAYMFITHDLATVRAIADEVVVMQQGRVVERGPKTELFGHRTRPTPSSCCRRCPRWTPTG